MNAEAETDVCHCGGRLQRDRTGMWRHVATQSLFCGVFAVPLRVAAPRPAR